MLRVSEIFESVAGEGGWMGIPCTFIRLAGCNLAIEYGGCVWCDTPYAQKPEDGIEMDEEKIAKKVEEYGHKHIEISGGEPLTQNLQPLLLKLRHGKDGRLNDRRIQLETNCSRNPMQYSLVSRIALSPKLGSSGMVKYMRYGYMSWLNEGDEVKFVISDEKDFKEALLLLRLNRTKANIIFTPVDGIDGKWIVEKILEEHIENIRVLCQLHKIFRLR